MTFYTPNWVNRLLDEEADHIAKHVSVHTVDESGKVLYPNDFRSYVDGRMPFTLFIDIDEIEQKVIKPNA